MGIRYNAVHLLSQTLPSLGDLSNKMLLTLGVQDCYFTYDEILSFLRRHSIPYRNLSPHEIMLTTGFKGSSPAQSAKVPRYIHQTTLFALLGFSSKNIFSMDVNGYESASIIHDLNVPIAPSLYEKFDLIIDGGTIEHVFSTKDALFNLCRMCKPGGILVNLSPVDMYHHGFINFSCDIFRDFFAANGCSEIALHYMAFPTHPRKIDRYYLTYKPEEFRLSMQPYYATVIYSAYKKVEAKSLTVPLQGFYKKLFETPEVNLESTRPRGTIARVLSSFVDRYYMTSSIVRSFMNERRGQRIWL